jgi:hypothetical protein
MCKRCAKAYYEGWGSCGGFLHGGLLQEPATEEAKAKQQPDDRWD